MFAFFKTFSEKPAKLPFPLDLMNKENKNVIYFFVCFIVLFGSNVWSKDSVNKTLKFDGLYGTGIHPKDHASYDYLRFYKDGSVISVASTGKPYHVFRWFDKDAKYISKGIYRLENGHITFSLWYENSQKDYEGNIRNGSLHLNVHYRLTDHKYSEIFNYYNFDKLWSDNKDILKQESINRRNNTIIFSLIFGVILLLLLRSVSKHFINSKQ